MFNLSNTLTTASISTTTASIITSNPTDSYSNVIIAFCVIICLITAAVVLFYLVFYKRHKRKLEQLNAALRYTSKSMICIRNQKNKSSPSGAAKLGKSKNWSKLGTGESQVEVERPFVCENIVDESETHLPKEVAGIEKCTSASLLLEEPQQDRGRTRIGVRNTPKSIGEGTDAAKRFDDNFRDVVVRTLPHLTTHISKLQHKTDLHKS